MFKILVKLAVPLYFEKSPYRSPSTGEMKNLTRLASKFGLTLGDTGIIANHDKQRRIIARNQKAGHDA
jgi:hypothetical protein